MTQEERDAIRVRCNVIKDHPFMSFQEWVDWIKPFQRDIFALLDALDAETKRAEALERALKDTYGAPSTGCEVCVYDTYDNKVCYSDCMDKSHWQFDEARFAVKLCKTDRSEESEE